MDDPLLYVGALVVVGFIVRMWIQDYREQRALADGSSTKAATGSTNFLPGSTPARPVAVTIAVFGALAILAVEVAGEYGLDVVAQQTEMSVLFGLYTLAAALIEELIFRGVLVYDQGSKTALVLGIVLVSILFALMHPYIWKYEVPDGVASWKFWECLTFQATPKAIFSTAILFANSLWFYAVRFFRWNPTRSLIPCFAAHAASNLGVFAIKAAQGKVTSWL